MRYGYLPRLVKLVRPSIFAEIGTWKGDRAVDCLKALREVSEDPFHYIGFDVFEEADAAFDKEEFNVKAHHSLESVHDRLMLFAEKDKNFTFELIKGNTRDYHELIMADMVFIDGGHSIQTIEHDLWLCRGCPVIVMDDYYTLDQSGNGPDITKVGCNAVVERLNHAVLPNADSVAGGGHVHMAVIPAFLAHAVEGVT